MSTLKISKHGLPSTYTNKGCRCEECRDAWREYCKKYTQKYRQNNPDKVRQQQHDYWAREMEKDPIKTRGRQRLANRRYKAKKKALKLQK